MVDGMESAGQLSAISIASWHVMKVSSVACHYLTCRRVNKPKIDTHVHMVGQWMALELGLQGSHYSLIREAPCA